MSIFSRLFSRKPQPKWKTQDGRVLYVRQMHARHLTNSIKLLLRRAGVELGRQIIELLPQDSLYSCSYGRMLLIIREFNFELRNFTDTRYDDLLAEYTKRGLDLEQIQDYESTVIWKVMKDIMEAYELARAEHANDVAIAQMYAGWTLAMLVHSLNHLGEVVMDMDAAIFLATYSTDRFSRALAECADQL